MTVRHLHWVDGKPLEPASGRYLPTIDPATRRQGDEVAAGSEPDVLRAVGAASAAWRSWHDRSAAARAEVLLSIADAIGTHRDHFVALERAATGKTDAQLAFEIAVSIDYFRYYSGIVRSFAGRAIEQGAAHHTFTRVEPYGVVAIITPWNLPLNQAARAVAPAIAVGNAVVLKPSEFTSASSVLLAQLATEVGLPDGVLNVVLGTGPDVGAPLVSHPAIRRIAFTGSVATGRRLAEGAADRLIPATLELGGKSPTIVFSDADIERAAEAAVVGIQANSGQVCSATTRLLVEEPVHDLVVGKIVDRVKGLRPGMDFGPIITERQFAKVLAYLDWAKQAGMDPVVGGSAYDNGPGSEGLYIQPTVFTRVDPENRMAQEEIFGPVLVTIPFSNEAEALRIANCTEYGLVAGIWTGDLARGLRLASQVDAGQVSVNGGALTVETPFGGYKNSGYGREKGVEALHDYVQVKTISVGIALS